MAKNELDSFHNQPIDTIFGRTIINPGTGPVEGAKEKEAHKNIAQLVKDVGLKDITSSRDASKDSFGGRFNDGRYAYILKYNQTELGVQMPGLPAEQVRYVDEKSQNILDFPRLFVWEIKGDRFDQFVWKYATNWLRDRFENREEE